MRCVGHVARMRQTICASEFLVDKHELNWEGNMEISTECVKCVGLVHMAGDRDLLL
jgi:hypothetical protein